MKGTHARKYSIVNVPFLDIELPDEQHWWYIWFRQFFATHSY